ncbi:hypothetical protein OJ253_2285, partial [Cryptosporidium canis]
MGRFLLTSTVATLFSYWAFAAGSGLSSPGGQPEGNGAVITVLDGGRNIEVTHSGDVKYQVELGYTGPILSGGELVVGEDLLVGFVRPEGADSSQSPRSELRVLESRGTGVQAGVFLGSPCVYDDGKTGIANILTCIKLFSGHDIHQDDIRYLFWRMRDYALQGWSASRMSKDDIAVDSYTYLPVVYGGLLHVSALFRYGSRYKGSSSRVLERLDGLLRDHLVAEIKPVYSVPWLRLEFNLGVGKGSLDESGLVVRENEPFGIVSITRDGRTHMESVVSPCHGGIVWYNDEFVRPRDGRDWRPSGASRLFDANRHSEEIMVLIVCYSDPSYLDLDSSRGRSRSRSLPVDVLVTDRFGRVGDWLLREQRGQRLNLIQVDSRGDSLTARRGLVSRIKATATLEDLRRVLVESMRSKGQDLSQLPRLAPPRSRHGLDQQVATHDVLREEEVLMDRLGDSKVILMCRMAPVVRMSDFERRVRGGFVPGNSYKYAKEKGRTESYIGSPVPVPKWEGLPASGWNNLRKDERKANLKAADYSGKDIQIFGPRPWNMDFLSLDVVTAVSMYPLGSVRYLLSREFLYLFARYGIIDDYSSHTSSLMRYSVEMYVVAGMAVSGESGSETLLGTVTIEFLAELKKRPSVKVHIFSEHTGIVRQVISTSTVACSLDPLVVISPLSYEEQRARLYFGVNSDLEEGAVLLSARPDRKRDFLTYPLSQNQMILGQGGVPTPTDKEQDLANRHIYLYPNEAFVSVLPPGPEIRLSLFSLSKEDIRDLNILRQVFREDVRSLLDAVEAIILGLQETRVRSGSVSDSDSVPIFTSSAIRRGMIKAWRKSKSKSILAQMLEAAKVSQQQKTLQRFGVGIDLRMSRQIGSTFKHVPKRRAALAASKLSLLQSLLQKRRRRAAGKRLKKRSRGVAKKARSPSPPRPPSSSSSPPGPGRSPAALSSKTFPMDTYGKDFLEPEHLSAPSAIRSSRKGSSRSSAKSPKRPKTPKRPSSEGAPGVPAESSDSLANYEMIANEFGPTYPKTTKFFVSREFELETSASIGDRSINSVVDSDYEGPEYLEEKRDASSTLSSLKSAGLTVGSLRRECSGYLRELQTSLDEKYGVLEDLSKSTSLDDFKGVLSRQVKKTNQYQECLKKLNASILAMKGFDIQYKAVRQNFSKKLESINKIRRNVLKKYKKCKSQQYAEKRRFYSLIKSQVSKYKKTANKEDPSRYQELLKLIDDNFKRYLNKNRECMSIFMNLRKEDLSLSEVKLKRFSMVTSIESLKKGHLELISRYLSYYKVGLAYSIIILSLEKLILASRITLAIDDLAVVKSIVETDKDLDRISETYKLTLNLERMTLEENFGYYDDVLRSGVHSIVVADMLLLEYSRLIETFTIHCESLDAGLNSLTVVLLSIYKAGGNGAQLGSSPEHRMEVFKKARVLFKRQEMALSDLADLNSAYGTLLSDLNILGCVLGQLEGAIQSIDLNLNAGLCEENKICGRKGKLNHYKFKFGKIYKKLSTKIRLLEVASERVGVLSTRMNSYFSGANGLFERVRGEYLEFDLASFKTDTSDIQTSDVSRDDSSWDDPLNSGSDSSSGKRILDSKEIGLVSNTFLYLSRMAGEVPSINYEQINQARQDIEALRVKLVDQLEMFTGGNVSDEVRRSLKMSLSEVVFEVEMIKNYFSGKRDSEIEGLGKSLAVSWSKTRIRRKLINARRRIKMEENRKRRIRKDRGDGSKWGDFWKQRRGSSGGDPEDEILERFGADGEDIKGAATDESSVDLSKEMRVAEKDSEVKDVAKKLEEGDLKSGKKRVLKKRAALDKLRQAASRIPLPSSKSSGETPKKEAKGKGGSDEKRRKPKSRRRSLSKIVGIFKDKGSSKLWETVSSSESPTSQQKLETSSLISSPPSPGPEPIPLPLSPSPTPSSILTSQPLSDSSQIPVPLPSSSAQSPVPEKVPSPPSPIPEKIPSPPSPIPEKIPSPPSPIPEKVPSPPSPIPEKVPSPPVPLPPPPPVPEKIPSPPSPIPEKIPSPPSPIPEKIPSPPPPVPEKIPSPPAPLPPPPPVPEEIPSPPSPVPLPPPSPKQPSVNMESEDELLEALGADGEDIKGMETDESSVDLEKELAKASKGGQLDAHGAFGPRARSASSMKGEDESTEDEASSQDDEFLQRTFDQAGGKVGEDVVLDAGIKQKMDELKSQVEEEDGAI